MNVLPCKETNVGKWEKVYSYEQIKEKEGVYAPAICSGDISMIAREGVFLVVLRTPTDVSILEYDMVKRSLYPAHSDTWSRFNYTKVDRQVCFSLIKER